ncbi:hypothetical protein [Prescottella equi]|uniref:hypothetical protein n=1 Tax=Rhodococcus hoagii TaxID=43767 RepID=UPI000A10B820|nr:hypothetical protein [Prescottella equi]ORL11669.1 hypothetical protein A6I85_17280 [Prescottella equi]
MASVDGWSVIGTDFRKGFKKKPLSGASAIVEVGGTQRRTTGTRMAVGTVIAPGVGTIIGAMAKKKSSNVYLTIQFADGEVMTFEEKAKKEGDFRKIAAQINTAATK